MRSTFPNFTYLLQLLKAWRKYVIPDSDLPHFQFQRIGEHEIYATLFYFIQCGPRGYESLRVEEKWWVDGEEASREEVDALLRKLRRMYHQNPDPAAFSRLKTPKMQELVRAWPHKFVDVAFGALSQMSSAKRLEWLNFLIPYLTLPCGAIL
jgi:hypothetical protein